MALVPGLVQSPRLDCWVLRFSEPPGATIALRPGNELEKSTTEGLPEDEISSTKDALRQGRSVVIVVADDKDFRVSSAGTY